jgi:hypothetical protein
MKTGTILLKLLWKGNILFVDDPAADFVGVVPYGFPKWETPPAAGGRRGTLHHFFNQD